MRIVAAGGGSGGHVTPVLAVINELSRFDVELEAYFICDKKFAPQARDLMSKARVSVDVSVISAGKIRRYHRVAWWRQLMDLPTTTSNIIDVGRTLVGVFQATWKIGRIRPDVVFTKGGFVCVPVAIAARLFRVPIVLHDSDAHPGLANRIISRWAESIATGAPLEHYASYPKQKSHYVGTPVDRAFRPYPEEDKRAARTWLGFPDIERPLVVVTGGGLGARRINEAMLSIGDKLVSSGFSVLHITGHGDFATCESKAPDSVHYKLLPFVSERMADVLGAADLVVTRAGATTLLELAALHQAVIIIPNPLLTGGHQLKNAAIYEKADAARIFDENMLSDTEALFDTISTLLSDEAVRTSLAKAIAPFARRDAALDVAKLIVEAAHKRVTAVG